MDFLGLNCSSPETDRIIDVSGGSVKQELQEQDLLRQLEESSDDSECTVDCTLSLGSSASSAKTQQRVDSKSDFWTKIDQKYCSSSQVLGNHGFGNGGFSSFIWGNGGSTCMPLRPELVNSSSRSEGYGFFGTSSMAFSSVYTNYTRVDRTPMSKILQRTAKDTPDFTSTRKCATCETTTTPLWRNGPKGTKSLCNACGIRFKKEERRARGYSDSDGGQGNERSPSKKPKI